MHYSTPIISITALPLLFTTAATALGINCRGSGLCPRATWNNQDPTTIVQALRDAIWDSAAADTTTYTNGDHIICVSQSQAITVGGGATANAGVSATFSLDGSIGEGGICVFPQDLKDGATLDLGTVRGLTDALLEHGCSTCGSVPVGFVTAGSNDPGDGILTFDYVANPFCDGSCISGTGSPTEKTKVRREAGDGPRREARPLFG